MKSGEQLFRPQDCTPADLSRPDRFDLIRNALVSFVYTLPCHRQDAEEIVDGVWERALDNADQFRGDSRFYTWLCAIAVNCAARLTRQGGRRVRRLERWVSKWRFREDRRRSGIATSVSIEAIADPDTIPEPDHVVGNGNPWEAHLFLADVIHNMNDPETAAILVDCKLKGMTNAEIAVVLEKEQKDVKNALARFFYKVRDRYDICDGFDATPWIHLYWTRMIKTVPHEFLGRLLLRNDEQDVFWNWYRMASDFQHCDARVRFSPVPILLDRLGSPYHLFAVACLTCPMDPPELICG